METILNKKLSNELNDILEDYSFIKINNEIVMFWRMKQSYEKDIISNEEYTQDDVIDDILEDNNIFIDSHCYISNKNEKSFSDIVKWNLENMESFKV